MGNLGWIEEGCDPCAPFSLIEIIMFIDYNFKSFLKSKKIKIHNINITKLYYNIFIIALIFIYIINAKNFGNES